MSRRGGIPAVHGREEVSGRDGMRVVAHPNIDLVIAHLRAGGAAPRAVEGMLVLPDAVTTAAAAAAALGVEVGQIANSLVFDADGAPLLVLTSGAHRVDTGKVAALIGAQRAVDAVVERAPSHPQRWSDHAPVTVGFRDR